MRTHGTTTATLQPQESRTMIRSFLRWACYYREVRIPFTQWTAHLVPSVPNQCPKGTCIDIDDRDGLISLWSRWEVRMQNQGPSWAERHAAWEAQRGQTCDG